MASTPSVQRVRLMDVAAASVVISLSGLSMLLLMLLVIVSERVDDKRAPQTVVLQGGSSMSFRQ